MLLQLLFLLQDLLDALLQLLVLLVVRGGLLGQDGLLQLLQCGTVQYRVGQLASLGEDKRGI